MMWFELCAVQEKSGTEKRFKRAVNSSVSKPGCLPTCPYMTCQGSRREAT